MLLSIGPRTSMQTGKKSIEGRPPSYFLNFSSDALVAAKPLSLVVKCTYRSANVPETVTSHARHLPALQEINVQPSGRFPSNAEIPEGSLRTGIEALEKSRQMADKADLRAPSNPPKMDASTEKDVRRKYINLGKLRALRTMVSASWTGR
ncbi:hypothetical protein HELRODRAFT_180065 [Helobdella robusta]|uniref:Uncharacterized protein n=1 Tax=Helobdella robusta TaxID=6412 RepID=T1FFF6_HELRO|nr:hypothetical protein HELRODRAFT_180065 [Helobdella robusta]ESN94736.1 hypothetical protein HELRODRAFT_180065 [Helobdella robusta]